MSRVNRTSRRVIPHHKAGAADRAVYTVERWSGECRQVGACFQMLDLGRKGQKFLSLLMNRITNRLTGEGQGLTLPSSTTPKHVGSV